MIQFQEKRNSIRHHCDGELTLLSTQRRSRHIDASLVNYSENGVCFFCHQPLVPGTTIIVRTSGKSYPLMTAEVGCQLRTMGFATIKWCQENQRQGRPFHEMGAVYLIPY